MRALFRRTPGLACGLGGAWGRSTPHAQHSRIGPGLAPNPSWARLASRLSGAAHEGPPQALNRSGNPEHGLLRPDLHIVLVHPQIPQNTGSIARTCAATRVGLHLVGPLGFEISASRLKRAGLDYWEHVCLKVHEDFGAFEAFYRQQPGTKRIIGYSKFASRHYAEEGLYAPATWLMFGAETTGLPAEARELISADGGQSVLVKIPMHQRHVRSLNLATSVGIGVFEALRQMDGPVLPAVTN